MFLFSPETPKLPNNIKKVKIEKLYRMVILPVGNTLWFRKLKYDSSSSR